MQASLAAVGARNIFRQEDDTNHLAGTARMGSALRTADRIRALAARGEL